MFDPVDLIGLGFLVAPILYFCYRACKWANDVPPPPWERTRR